jgi:hypothetical protein
MPTTRLRLKGSAFDSDDYPPRRHHRFGDRTVFTDDITSFNPDPANPASLDQPTAGQHSGFCFLLREPNVWLCQAGFLLPGFAGTTFPNGGQIQARGLMDFATGVPVRAAISGGFGDYDSAGGQIEVSFPAANQSQWDMPIVRP